MHIRADKYFSLLVSYYLIENGADPKKSNNLVFGKKSIFSKKILCIILDRLTQEAHGKILWTYVTEDDKKRFNNAMVDSVNVFSEIMSVEGVEIGIYFKVTKEHIDISFRSNDLIDVAKLASFFGGGGHKVASGAKVEGGFDDIRLKVINKAVEALKENSE
jgi:bifunctional oligoribonuclease and PAP phosphatase NrnA